MTGGPEVRRRRPFACSIASTSASTLAVPLFAALLTAGLAGCESRLLVRRCDACIEKEGVVYCGKSTTDLKKHPDIPVEESKIAAARAACTEYGARKGGGYAGPPFEAARTKCADAVRPKDLMRARCDEVVVRKPWNPRDGVDAL